MKSNEKYSDVLLHAKRVLEDETEERRVIYPMTRYQDVINAPRVSENILTSNNPPFLLYITSTEEMDNEDIFKLFGTEW